MDNFRFVKSTFLRQRGPDDCGAACLAMILNYQGDRNRAKHLLRSLNSPAGGLSLFELKTAALELGFIAYCASADLAYLKTINTPAILHMLNENGDDHFQVYYGRAKNDGQLQFLMADPAKQVYYLNESELAGLWESRSALFFDGIDRTRQQFSGIAALRLFTASYFPSGLWAVIPLLGLISAFLGISLTWIIQKGWADHDFFAGSATVIYVTALLLLLGVFRSLISYLRQYILVDLSLDVSANLMAAYTEQRSRETKRPSAPDGMEASLADMQKVHNSILAMLSMFLSDGTQIVLFLSASIYISPLAGLLDLAYILAAVIFSWRRNRLNSYKIAHLKTLRNYHRDQLRLMGSPGRFKANTNQASSWWQKQSEFSRFFALHNLYSILVIDLWSNVQVLLVFLCGVVQFKDGAFSYTLFSILVLSAYLVSRLLQNMLNTIPVLSEGIDAWFQFDQGDGALQSN